jgi:tetratricopeptide (TPR) repeat protein
VNTYASELPIGEILVKVGLVTQKQVEEVVQDSGPRQRLIGKTLVARGWLQPEQLRAALAAQSLLRDGIIDSFKALKALSSSCFSNISFEDALKEIGVQVKEEPSCKLGALLVEAGIATAKQMEVLYKRSELSNEPLGVLLVNEGYLSESYLDAALELQVRVRDGMFSREQAIEALKRDPRKLLDMIAPHMMADEKKKRSTKAAIRLGELFMRAGLITQAEVSQALELSLAQGQPIGEMLVAQNFITRPMLDAALAVQQMITKEHLSTGEGTACLVKVSNSHKPVSECLMELNLLKQQPASTIINQKITQKLNPSARITIANLPALSLNAIKQPEVVGTSETSAATGTSQTSQTATSETINTVSYLSKAGLLKTPAAGSVSAEATASTISEHTQENAEPISISPAITLHPNPTAFNLPFDDSEITWQELFSANFYYNKEERKGLMKALRHCYSSLGRVLTKRQELIEAEDLLQTASNLSKDNEQTQDHLEDVMFLSCLYLKQGKSWQAEKMLRRLLSQTEASEHPAKMELALVHHRLALSYCHLSLLFKAEKHFKHSAELIEKLALAKASHVNNKTGLEKTLASVYRDYAVLLTRMRREQEADKFYCQARKLLSSSLLAG